MKGTITIGLICITMAACSNHKIIAQTKTLRGDETLIKNINSSSSDTQIINPKLKQLQQKNDLLISFATLNYAWIKRGNFYVLAKQNKTWKMYRFDAKLSISSNDAATDVSPQNILATEAENIETLYTNAQLWKTSGDNNQGFCTGNKDCNITDAETWTMSVATNTNIHTTTYYAPEFFEQCCPGNTYRNAFVHIAKEITKLAPGNGNLQEK